MRATGIRAAVVFVAMGLTWLVAGAQAADNTDGFIYGTVTTRSGNTYTGPMRWGDEEAFWDDLFHSSKESLPYDDYRRDRDRARIRHP